MRVRVFQSGKGDCLLLRSADGKNMLIDGGLVGRGGDAYSPNVAPFLGRMQRRREVLDLVCVSHIDQDHIGGILRLLNDHFEWRVFDFQTTQGLNVARPRNARPPAITDIWHNAFHEQIGLNLQRIEDAVAAAVPESLALGLHSSSHGDNFMQGLATSMREAAKVSRRLGPNQLGIALNREFGGRLAMSRRDAPSVRLGSFDIAVIGPTARQLGELRELWNEWLESEKGRRQIAAIGRAADEDEDRLGQGHLDEVLAQSLGRAIGRRSSVTEANVASIVMYVKDGPDDILLTGDARDDHVVEDLVEANIADADGHLHVDVLKVQHHGSENNISVDFAKKITANHYLLCGNGQHENPDLRAIETIINSRLGSARQRSTNRKTGNRFKLWFSSDADSADADAHHMRALEALMERRAQSSRGQMRYHFSGRASFALSP